METVEACDVYPYEREDGEAMNPRDFSTRESAEHIAALAEQFRRNRLNPGQPVMRPILYRDGGIYRIVDGECRVRAMRLIGTRRFLADVYDDLGDAELARAEAAKAMVETDCKLGLSAAEMSRGVQTMLALDIPDEEVAAAARTDEETVRRARRGARRVQDAAYDMTLDRLAAIAEFEGDEHAVGLLRDCPQSGWRRVYDSLCAERDRRANLDALLAVMAEAGVEVAEGLPGGFSATCTFGTWRDTTGEAREWLAGRDASELRATVTDYGVAVLEPSTDDEGQRAMAERRADFCAALADAKAARRAWVGERARDLSAMPRTARLLADRALAGDEAAELEEAMGAPLDRAPTQLAVALGMRGLWPLSDWYSWEAVAGGESGRPYAPTAAALVEAYEAMAADGYEPNWAETQTYEACRARAGEE